MKKTKQNKKPLEGTTCKKRNEREMFSFSLDLILLSHYPRILRKITQKDRKVY